MAIEYVYALHDFEPQNDDEIAFVAGERIEVLERDDAYGDGWWTVSIYPYLMIRSSYFMLMNLFPGCDIYSHLLWNANIWLITSDRVGI